MKKLKEEPKNSVQFSQDDIDQLLNSAADKEKAADQGETAEAGTAAAVNRETNLIDQDDIDQLLKSFENQEETTDEEEEPDQIILEEEEEGFETQGNKNDLIDEDNEKEKKSWYRSKLLLISGSVLLFLISCSISFFQYHRQTYNMNIREKPKVISFPIEKEKSELDSDPGRKVVSIALKEFIVPAPLSKKDAAYMIVEITIELFDIAADEIKKHEPFFRSVIYDIFLKTLNLQNKSKTETLSLNRLLIKAINDALPKELKESDRLIKKIVFNKFAVI